MIDYSKIYPDRPFIVAYHADAEKLCVEQVQAFECSPNEPSLRWIPELRFSCFLNSGSLFTSKQEAKLGLAAKLEAELDKLEKRLKQIGDYLGK